MSIDCVETRRAAEPLTQRRQGSRLAGVSDASRPLRIIHVLRAPLGGLFRHVLDLSRAQIAQGHQVGIIADSLTGGPNGEAKLAELAPSLALGLSRTPMRRMPHPSDLPAFLHVVSRIRATRPDVVHGHGSKGGLYARLTGFLPNGLHVVRGYTPHGGSFNYKPASTVGRMFMATERLLARRTDILLFESAYIARRFDLSVGACKALRRIVPNGISSIEFIPVEPKPDAADFLYVGELRFAKGIDTLITALKQVSAGRSPAPRLGLVGAGPDRNALEAQVQAMGMSDQVAFHGILPARTAFALGKVLVVPSRAESLPYIVLEAAGAQIPLIATNVGGIPEIYGAYANRLIPCDEPDTLAREMIAALDGDRAKAAEAAGQLARTVESRFSFDNMVAAVIDGYREALAEKLAVTRAASTIG